MPSLLASLGSNWSARQPPVGDKVVVEAAVLPADVALADVALAESVEATPTVVVERSERQLADCSMVSV